MSVVDRAITTTTSGAVFAQFTRDVVLHCHSCGVSCDEEKRSRALVNFIVAIKIKTNERKIYPGKIVTLELLLVRTAALMCAEDIGAVLLRFYQQSASPTLHEV